MKYILGIIFLIIFAPSLYAESMGICLAICKAEVMDVNQCIQEEKNYWQPQTNVTESAMRESCVDLIRNERLYCEGECIKQHQGNDAAEEFFDKHVRHFPDSG